MTDIYSTTRTVDQAIDLLNSAMQADPEAMDALLKHRVPCNDAMGDHPTIQCGVHRHTPIVELNNTMLPGPPKLRYEGASEENYTVGLLGIINGIFGLRDDDSQYGYIAAVVNDDGKVQMFTRSDKATVDNTKGASDE